MLRKATPCLAASTFREKACTWELKNGMVLWPVKHAVDAVSFQLSSWP